MAPKITLQALLGAFLAAQAPGLASAAANTTVGPDLPRECIHNPAGPLQPNLLADYTCKTPLDQRFRSIADRRPVLPWTHTWNCAPSSLQPDPATGAVPRSPYCGFTKDDFRGTQGLVVLTTAAIAADVARQLEDRSPQWNRMPPPAPLAPPGSVQVRDIEGKGLGVVAGAAIPKGTVIMRDDPAVLKLVDRPASLNKREAQRVGDAALDKLAADERRQILSLAKTMGGNMLDDVLRTNAYQVKFNGVPHHALFKEISRMELIAYEDIQPGEEITVSYAPLNLLSEERSDLLMASWSFECKCPLCADEEATKFSDANRRGIDRIMEELGMREVRTPQLVRVLMEELEDIMDEEGLDAQRGDLYGVVSNVHLDMGDLAGALRYAEVGTGFQEQYKGWDDGRTWQARRFVGYLHSLIEAKERKEKEGKGKAESKAA